MKEEDIELVKVVTDCYWYYTHKDIPSVSDYINNLEGEDENG